MLARCCIATETFSVAIRNSPQAKELKDRIRSNWLVAPGAMTSRGVAVGIRGTWRLCNKGLGGAVDVDWRGAQGLPTKGPASRVGGNCWSRGQKVRLLLKSAVVESRPSWAPPIRCRYFLRRWRVCLPVVMLIASARHFEESENGVTASLQINSSESRASAASNATPIRTATTNGRTSTRSWRVRRQLEHRRLPGNAANPKAIEPSAFWCGGRSNGSRFNCAQHVAVLGVDDPVGVRSHQ